MQFQIALDDPKMLVKLLTRSIGVRYAADTKMPEYIRNEDEETPCIVSAELESPRK